MNGVVLRSVRALLVTSGLATKLWGEAFKFVVTIRNFSPSKAIKDSTPYELFEGRIPDVSGLRVWGCAATYFVPKQRRKGKQDTTAKDALFLGYPKSTTGYRVLDLVTGHIVESRDVKFREQWTLAADYVDQLLDKFYAKKPGVVLPVSIPYVRLPLLDYSSSCSSDETALALHSSDEVGPMDAKV
ncbi:putative integrase catalytic domain-containing protein [Phytophthora infestans]|uniref:Putative integrase catalytic domain-containing protein n=1 Tax=Phytophthora infestans TaxID=4787 RepID=A0A8S9V8P2_PHYIN|nr:putative integrase catalytic domain-containing protein [Phytophthora infestans]